MKIYKLTKMIFPETYLNICDNCGAKTVKCLKILHNKFPGRVGDFIIVVIKKYNPKKKLRPGEIHLAIITETKYQLYRKNGVFIKTFANNTILLKKDGLQPFGNRISGVLPFELKQKGLGKLLSLAEGSY